MASPPLFVDLLVLFLPLLFKLLHTFEPFRFLPFVFTALFLFVL